MFTKRVAAVALSILPFSPPSLLLALYLWVTPVQASLTRRWHLLCFFISFPACVHVPSPLSPVPPHPFALPCIFKDLFRLFA